MEQQSQNELLRREGTHPHLPLLPLRVDQHDEALSSCIGHRHHLRRGHSVVVLQLRSKACAGAPLTTVLKATRPDSHCKCREWNHEGLLTPR